MGSEWFLLLHTGLLLRWMAVGGILQNSQPQRPSSWLRPPLHSLPYDPTLQLQQWGAFGPSGVPLQALLPVGTSSTTMCK